MATFKLTKFAPSDEFLAFSFLDGPLEMGAHSPSKATFVEDADKGDKIVVKGTFLQYIDDVLVSGKITSMIVYDWKGRELGTIEKCSVDVSDLNSTNPLSAVDLFLNALKGKDRVLGTSQDDFMFGIDGNDTLIGGAGNDVMSGDNGNDRYTGGTGSDTFYSLVSSNDDVVTDFHAKGRQGVQDYIYTDGTYELTSQHRGKDTLVTITSEESPEDIATILLKGVRMTQITDADFIFGA